MSIILYESRSFLYALHFQRKGYTITLRNLDIFIKIWLYSDDRFDDRQSFSNFSLLMCF